MKKSWWEIFFPGRSLALSTRTIYPELRPYLEMIQNPKKFEDAGMRTSGGILLVGSQASNLDDVVNDLLAETDAETVDIQSAVSAKTRIGDLGPFHVNSTLRRARAWRKPLLVKDVHVFANKKAPAKSLVESFVNQMRMGGCLVVATADAGVAIDPRVRGPGCLERSVLIPESTAEEREAFLRKISSDVRTEHPGVLTRIAERTRGVSNATLRKILNQSVFRAVSCGRDAVSDADLEWARFEVLHGPFVAACARDTRSAHHEAAHAIVGMFSAFKARIMTLTIRVRNGSGGFMEWFHQDSTSCTRAEAQSRIAMLLAGMEGEKMMYGNDGMSTGSESDIQQALAIAEKMVADCGMAPSGSLGVENEDDVQEILQKAVLEARHILESRRPAFAALSAALMERETLVTEEIEAIVGLK